MNTDVLMAAVMYGITDDVSAMVMVPYLWKSMDRVTRSGTDFTTRSEGIGDVKVIGGYDLFKSGGHTVELSAGFGLPTGSIDERDDTPSGPDQLLELCGAARRPARTVLFDRRGCPCLPERGWPGD